MGTTIDFLHLLATVIWIGGALFITLVLGPGLASIAPPERGKLMEAVSKRFGILAWVCVLVLLGTGGHRVPEGKLLDLASTYGQVLTVKHFLVLLMIVVALLLTFVAGPKVKALAPKPGEPPSPEFMKAQKLGPLLGATNALLGVGVLVCATLLGGLV